MLMAPARHAQDYFVVYARGYTARAMLMLPDTPLLALFSPRRLIFFVQPDARVDVLRDSAQQRARAIHVVADICDV